MTVNDIPADFYLDEDDTQANFLVCINPENDMIFWIGGKFSEANGPHKAKWLCGESRSKGAGGVFAVRRKQSLADFAVAKRSPGLLC